MKDILVIGGVTIDVVHIAGKTVTSPGGAGMYTAAAALKASGNVTLFAQRPNPMPSILGPIADRLHWVGPEISPDEVGRLEIVHHGGGKATLVKAFWGAQANFIPTMLPKDLSEYQIIHIAAIGTARRQLEFLETCRYRRAKRISVGTYARVVYGETKNVRALFDQADLFFMNENEANGLFGSVSDARTQPDHLLFITLGDRGALVITGEEITRISAPGVQEIDPTGAGDTFCGATLAGLARREDPVAVAREAVLLASQMIGSIGPVALIQ